MSAWLQEQDIEPIVDDEFYRLEELLEQYKKFYLKCDICEFTF